MPDEFASFQADQAPQQRTVPPRIEVGRQRVIQGDCLSQMRDLESQSCDLIVTSPPYNIGVAYATYNDRRPRREYIEWLMEVGTELKRVLRNDGSFFLNVGGISTDPWIPLDIAAAFRNLFCLQNQIVWVKSIAIGANTIGHFKPVNSQRFLNNGHETVFHFTKSGNVALDRLAVGVPFKDKINITRWGHEHDRRCAGNVWFVPYETVKSRRGKFNHPAGFPTALPRRCIQLHGRIDATVLDPFLGAGTTLVAAEELGLRGIGIEIDHYYFHVAVERLQQAVVPA